LVLNANWEVISFFKSQFQNQNPQALSPKAPFLYYNSHDLLSVRRYSFFGLTARYLSVILNIDQGVPQAPCRAGR
jgi:hypothetical protein